MTEQTLASAELRPAKTTDELAMQIWDNENKVFQRHKNLISRASDEIKEYELYLKQNEIHIEFGFRIPDTEEKYLPQVGDSLARESYSIHWRKCKGQNEMRLCYLREGMEYDFIANAEMPSVEMRPIVEAPLPIRMYLRGWLSKFNVEFSSYLESMEDTLIESLPR